MKNLRTNCAGQTRQQKVWFKCTEKISTRRSRVFTRSFLQFKQKCRQKKKNCDRREIAPSSKLSKPWKNSINCKVHPCSTNRIRHRPEKVKESSSKRLWIAKQPECNNRHNNRWSSSLKPSLNNLVKRTRSLRLQLSGSGQKSKRRRIFVTNSSKKHALLSRKSTVSRMKRTTWSARKTPRPDDFKKMKKSSKILKQLSTISITIFRKENQE